MESPNINNDYISRVAAKTELYREWEADHDAGMIDYIGALDRVPAVENKLTPRARAIIMAYTGVAMLKGVKLYYFYEYLSELYGHPVWTHELAGLGDIAERAKADFIALCAEVNDDGE